MRLALALLPLLWASAAAAQPASPTPEAARARIAQVEPMVAQSADAGLLLLLASDYVQVGDPAKAAEHLRRLLRAGGGVYPDPDSPLRALEGDGEVGLLLAQLKRALPVTRRARVALTVSERGLVPEGLAYDTRSGDLFLGDGVSRRILRVDSDGKARTFRSLELTPLGLKADAERRRLWAAATNAFWNPAMARAELLAFDLDSGRPMGRFTHPEARSFNDMDVAPNGDVYVSDSLGGAVFRLRAGGTALERVATGLGYPNGVAVSEDGRHVFVAHGAGPARIDAATSELLRLPRPDGFSGLGIDGLYWRDGGLIGVQNVGTPGRVVRMELSPQRDRITGWRPLEAGNPHFDVPTTGALGPGRLFVLANAQLPQLKDDGTIADPARLKPIVILELPTS